MTERNAAEIRAYLKASEYGLAIAKTRRKKRAYYASLGIALHTDLPRALEAAVKLRRALRNVCYLLWAQGGRIYEDGGLIDKTSWLEPSLESVPVMEDTDGSA